MIMRSFSGWWFRRTLSSSCRLWSCCSRGTGCSRSPSSHPRKVMTMKAMFSRKSKGTPHQECINDGFEWSSWFGSNCQYRGNRIANSGKLWLSRGTGGAPPPRARWCPAGPGGTCTSRPRPDSQPRLPRSYPGNQRPREVSYLSYLSYCHIHQWSEHDCISPFLVSGSCHGQTLETIEMSW